MRDAVESASVWIGPRRSVSPGQKDTTTDAHDERSWGLGVFVVKVPRVNRWSAATPGGRPTPRNSKWSRRELNLSLFGDPRAGSSRWFANPLTSLLTAAAGPPAKFDAHEVPEPR